MAEVNTKVENFFFNSAKYIIIQMIYIGNKMFPNTYMNRETPLPHMHHQNVSLFIYGSRNVS